MHTYVIVSLNDCRLCASLHNRPDPQLQIDALKAAKCKPIYVEQRSGKNMNRPELTRCLDML